jgi:aryl-alcohol dehydrogenase-like predicted oxidoreductase
MEYVKLGRTGLKISRLILGTGNFGSNASEGDSRAVMDSALEAGINFFDTGDVYGGKEDPSCDRPGGLTEAIIGRWLEQYPSRRDRIVLATKVWGVMGPSPNDRGLSAFHIRRACEESLRRLRSDHIDLYQMHAPDPETPFEEIWEAMDRLVREGKVLYVGTSNFPAWMLTHAHHIALQRHLLGVVSEQSRYNLADRRAESELLPAAHAFGIGFIAYSPLCGGLLGGVLDSPKGGQRAGGYVQWDLGRLRPQVERWEACCRELGHPPAHVALAWMLTRPLITAPIIGPRTVDQLNGNLAALEVKLDEPVLKKLEEIWGAKG